MAALRQVREVGLPLLLMAASAAVIGLVRPALYDRVARSKESSDAYALPPPEQLPVLSLGYRAALADLIWAHVMVTQGERIKQHRRFDFAARYFESIFALEPTYRSPYLLVDTILTFGATKATTQDAHDARRLLEQGLRERPNDAQLHIQTGSFMAYLAPGLIPESEHDEWRLKGGQLMVRAGELGTADTNLQWHSLAGVGQLNRSGQRAAALAFLERLFEIAENEELRGEILRQMRGLRAEDSADRARASADRFNHAWRDDLPFVSRGMILLLGPLGRPGLCAGSGRSERPECAHDWKTWAQR